MLFLWVRLYNVYDWFYNLFRYYFINPKFALIDTALLLSYFFKSPYRIARLTYPESGPYGETPFRVMSKILSQVQLAKDSHVIEVGCGRGRLAFWLQLVRKYKVIGLDINAIFIERARSVATVFHVPITFRRCLLQDCEEVSSADLIYFYILHLSEDELRDVASAFITKRTKATIVTVSYWFGEVVPNAFQLIGTCKVRFVWGDATVYLQKLIDLSFADE